MCYYVQREFETELYCQNNQSIHIFHVNMYVVGAYVSIPMTAHVRCCTNSAKQYRSKRQV